jgi:hypothetical protein
VHDETAASRVVLYADTLPACAMCTLRLRALPPIGRHEDAVLLRDLPIVERDSDGRYIAAVRNAQDHEVIVYDSGGRFLRTVSRFGSGPGEFRSVQDLHITPGDSLVVAHDGYISVFDSAGTFVRTVRLDPGPWMPYTRIVAVGPAGILLNAVNLPRVSATPQSTRLMDEVPLHLFAHTGEYVRGFGPDDLLAAYWKARDIEPLPVRIAAVVSSEKSGTTLSGNSGTRDHQP